MDDPWCQALHECTACLREQNAEDADTCLAYLIVLEKKLEREGITVASADSDGGGGDANSNRVPPNQPPSWLFLNGGATDLGLAIAQEVAIDTQPIRHPPPDRRLPGQRLLTRIFTAQSEVFAMKATHVARIFKDWTLASSHYETSIHKIHQALDVTDTAISQWWGHWERCILGEELVNQHEEELLAKDASIVVVALESLEDRHDKLITMAKREEANLVRKLTPHWESRDKAKQRMGAKRWKNNPRPKFDFVKMRAELEEELGKRTEP